MDYLDNYYSGTSNLVLPVPNKSFYPPEFKEASRLHYYASMQRSLEINQSFYTIPRAVTMAKWADEVHEDFRFSFKLFKGFTHDRAFNYSDDDLERFMHAISAVGRQAGCLLVQLPPSASTAVWPQLHRLLSLIRQHDPAGRWKIALEVRNLSLYADHIVGALREMDIALVNHDIKKPANKRIAGGQSFYYFRFHGPQGDYRGSYDDAELEEYANVITGLLKQGKPVFAYFNNTLGRAWENLGTLNSVMASLADS